MSIRSLIGYKKGKRVHYVYCHSDGYVDGVGEILRTNYKNIEKVKELIALGDLSVLSEKINPDPNKPHSFDGRFDGTGVQEDVCIAYGRDRGETGVGSKICFDFEYGKKGNQFGVDFIYFFEDKNWYYKALPFSKKEKYIVLLSSEDIEEVKNLVEVYMGIIKI